MFYQKIFLILIKLYSIYLYSVSCNPSLNGLVTINDGNDQIQEESSSYLQFAKIPDEDDTRKILLQMGNHSVDTTTNDLDFSASANIAQMLNNLNDNEQRHLQQQLQTNEDPLQKILPKVKFDCKNLKEGYYADPEFDCEVFHFCKSNGFRFTLVCPPKAKYNQKAMTCVYEDNQLYGCPQKESINNLNSDWDQKFNLTSYNETKIGNDEIDIMSTNNSSSIDKNSVEEENKLSSWNDIINKSNKLLSYTSSSTIIPDKTYNLNQILTTISTNNVEEKNITENWPSTSYLIEPSVQYGTRFNSINTNKNKTISKKLSVSSGYEDLYTKYQKKKKQNHIVKAVGTTTINPITTVKNNFSIDEDILSDVSSTEQVLTKSFNSNKQTESEEKTNLTEGNLNLNNSSIKDHQNIITEFSSNAEKNKLAYDNESNKIILNETEKDFKIENQQNSYEKNDVKYSNNLNSYQLNKNNLDFLNNLDFNRITDKNISPLNSQQEFLNDFNEGGFKPIFMDNDNKFLNSNHRYNNDFKNNDVSNNYDSFVLKESLNQSNHENHKNFFNQNNSPILPTLFTPNPTPINNYSTSSSTNSIINFSVKNPNIEYSDQSNKTFNQNQTLSNNLINKDSIYQSRENFKLMVKEVSNEKLKDFIKSNDLVDLSSTTFSNLGSKKTVAQPLNEEYLKYQTDNKFKNKSNSTFLNNGKNLFYNQLSNNLPDFRSISNLKIKNDKRQQLNKDQFSNSYLPKLKPENNNYNAYKLDSISEDPNYKYDYVFGLSKFLPSLNGQLPSFFLDSNLMAKNPLLYPEFYSSMDMQAANTNNLDQTIMQKKFIQNDRDHLMAANQQFLSNSKLPIWLKNKFLNKPSTINRNTGNNLFSNSNNFLHSAASSSFNYPLYELPPPSILKQQQQNRQNSQPIALPLISSNLGVASSNSQTQNEVNMNKLISSSVLNSPSNVLTDNLAFQQNNPLKSITAQNAIPNTRKNFFSQLSRLFSSASIPRPVRVPYTTVNLASAFSSLTQPFSKLQIDNFSNQIFSPINRFLNATTSYIPFSKENTVNQKTAYSSTSKPNTINEDDVIDNIENQILNSNILSPYTLNNKNVYNQGLTNQPASYLPSQPSSNILNLNNFNLNSLPMNQPFYEPIKRSFKNNYNHNLLKSFTPEKNLNPFLNNFKFPSIERDDNQIKYFSGYQNLLKKPNQEYLLHQYNPYSLNSQNFDLISSERQMNDLITKETTTQDEDDYEDSSNFIKRRKKRNIPFNSPFFHALQKNNFQSKFLFPLVPQLNLMPTPIQNNYMHSSNYLYGVNSALPLAYPTPVIPIIPNLSTPIDSDVQESQKNKKIEIATLSPIIKKSILTSTLNASNNSFVPLSIVSAANQIATSLSNLSKHRKQTKKTIEKHLSKFTSKSTELNTTETKSVSSFQSPNKTIEYHNPQAKPFIHSWEYSSQMNPKPLNDFPIAPYPFINNFRSNLPSFNFVPDNLNTANYQQNTKIIPTIQDLNSIFYQASPTNNFPLAQIPKLKIEYRPAKTMNSLISSFSNDYFKTNEINEHFGKKPKLETSNEFRDLLNTYKQSSNLNEEFYTPLKSIYSTNKLRKEEGQTSNNKYSTNYGFPKSALKIMTVENKQKIGSNQYNHYLKNSKSKNENLPQKILTVKQIDELSSSFRSLKTPNSFDYQKNKNDDFLNFDSDSSINFFDKNFHKEIKNLKVRKLPTKKLNAYRNLDEDDYYIIDKANLKKKNFDKNNYDTIYDSYMNTPLKKSNKKSKKNMSNPNFDKNYEEGYFSIKPKQNANFIYKTKMTDSKNKLSPQYSESSNRDYKPEDYEEEFFNEKYFRKDKNKFKSYQNNLDHKKSRITDYYPERISSKKINSDNFEEDVDQNYQYDTNNHKNQKNNYSNSRLIKTNSFSFEIPNHSKHEDVEFEKLNDKNIHEKQEFNKFITNKRPSYSLDYSSRKTSSIGKLSKHGQPLQTFAPSPDYYDQSFKSKNDEKESNFASSKSEKDFFYKVPNLKFKPKKNLSPNFEVYPKEKKINHYHYILHSHKNDRHNQENNYDEVKPVNNQENYYDSNYSSNKEKYRNSDKKDVNKDDFNDQINEDNYKNDKKNLKQSFDWHSSIQHNNDKSASNNLNKQEHASLDNIKLFDENEFNIFSDNEQFNQNMSNNFEKNQFEDNLFNKNNQLNLNNDAFYENPYREKIKEKQSYKKINNYDNPINENYEVDKINANLLNKEQNLNYKEEKMNNLNNIDEDYEVEPNYPTKMPSIENNRFNKNPKSSKKAYDDLDTTINYNPTPKFIVSTTLAPYTVTKKITIQSTTVTPKAVKPNIYKSKYMTSNEYTEKKKTNLNSQNKIVGKLMTRTTERPITTTSFSSNKNINYHKTEIKNPNNVNSEIKKNTNTVDPVKKREYKPYTRVVQTLLKKETKNNTENKNPKIESQKVFNSNLQNSSTTINTQVLDKLPISIDSIFDSIDEENFDYYNDQKNGNESNEHKRLQNKKGDLSENSLFSSLGSKNNSIRPILNTTEKYSKTTDNSLKPNEATNKIDETTQQSAEYGSRLNNFSIGGGKFNPKVSVKASYSSVSSTMPKALAQKMDSNLKNDFINNLNSSFSKKEIVENSLKKNTSSVEQKNISLQDKSNKSRLFISWRGFNARQQKLIEQKKKKEDLDEKIKKKYSIFVNKKSLSESKSEIEKPIKSITTLKTTATTVPTTTLKTITEKYSHNLKYKNNFINKYKNENFNKTEEPIKSLKNNYNFKINTDKLEIDLNELELTTSKPYRKIFTSLIGGSLQEKTRQKT